jgi:hypothetical protein
MALRDHKIFTRFSKDKAGTFESRKSVAVTVH